MSETNQSRFDRVVDGAAGFVGKSIWGAGYCAGRVAPKVRRAAQSLAQTSFCQFVSFHFGDGFASGEETCLQKEAEAKARKMYAMGGEVAREASVMFLTDIYRLFGIDKDPRSALR